MMIEPHWRFNPDFRFKETPKQAFTFRSTVLQSYGAHNFSHCDAPQHVDRGMETIETMDIRRFSGDACLIDVSDLGDEAQIDWEIMETRSSHLRSGDIVLIRSNHAGT
ncbi:cyclase family protein [Actinobaculum suis]|nr:cyclase family protein [Actinobaculum suis]